ncbi:MAG: calcium/sodium antiporter [Candidatus Campbellbacteria bacterium]|nr:calcium/sodium antiporter [Candidatus Campbellbacteria bacterium]
MLDIVFWIFVFVLTILLLVKGSDLFLDGTEKLGYALGLRPFVLGVFVLGFGTSLPELSSAISAVVQGSPSLVPSLVIGSNVANILLIIGIAAIFSIRIYISKRLSREEVPIFITATVIFLAVIIDREIVFQEAIVLFISGIVYIIYTLINQPEQKNEDNKKNVPRTSREDNIYNLVKLISGGLIVGVSSIYLIRSAVFLSSTIGVGEELIAITAIAIGTSLPELSVSIQAARKKNIEIILGNIFGSNIFNSLIIAGLAGLFSTLPIDGQALSIGMPFLAVSSILIAITVFARVIRTWEGLLYIALYIIFIGNLFELF